MTFQSTIQSFISVHTDITGAGVQCAIDWAGNAIYQIGTPDGINIYTAKFDLITGLELAFQPSTAYTPVNAFHEFPVGFDVNGAYFSGSLYSFIAADKNNLALRGELADPSNFTYTQGHYAPLTDTSGGHWMLCTGPGLQAGFEYFVCVNTASLVFWTPGKTTYSNRTAACCSGPSGAGIGWVCSSPLSTDTPAGSLIVFKINVNSGVQGSGTLTTIAATTVDAGWTQISQQGMCLDQTDGNLLIFCSGQSAATHQNYLIKVNSTTGAITWSLQLPNAATGTLPADQCSQSSIKNQVYALSYTTGGGSNFVALINTSSGTITSTISTGLNGIVQPITQCYNDSIGAIIGGFGYTLTAGGPTLLNSTPSTFRGWSALYVQPAIVAVTKPYFIERMTQIFDDNVPDNQHFTVDSGIVPPSAILATVGVQGFAGIRCYGLNLLTDAGATTLAGVLGGLDIGNSSSAINGIVDFPFTNTFTLAYVQSFGTTTFPQVFLDQYQVAIDSGTTDGSSHRLYYVIPFMVGFPYTSQGQLLRPNHGEDAGARAGPAMGKIRRNHWYSALLYRTQGDLQFGTDFGSTLKAAPLGEYFAEPVQINQPKLFSGTITRVLDDTYSLDGMISFQQTRPGPCTILSIAGFIQTNDK